MTVLRRRTKRCNSVGPHAKNVFCVLYVRGATYCLHLPSLTRESSFPARETLCGKPQFKFNDGPPTFERSTSFAAVSSVEDDAGEDQECELDQVFHPFAAIDVPTVPFLQVDVVGIANVSGCAGLVFPLASFSER